MKYDYNKKDIDYLSENDIKKIITELFLINNKCDYDK